MHYPKGRNSSNLKLTAEEVIEIRQSSLSETQAARKYGVSPSQIGRIRRNEHWKHLLEG